MTFPNVSWLRENNPTTTSFMELRRKELSSEGKVSALSHTWVPYGRISANLRRAVLVAEDDSFFQHQGIDKEGLNEALRKNWEQKRIGYGGSTITQQLAKNLYLTPSRNPVRKVKEYFIARALERELTKKRILEIYLNVVEFGETVYGAEAASLRYFGKSASSLSPREAALLAGCLPNPRLMNPAKPNKRLRFRQRMILSRVRRWGHIFEKDVLTEKKPKKRVEVPADVPVDVPVATTEGTTMLPGTESIGTESMETTTGTPPVEASPPDPVPPPAETPAPPTVEPAPPVTTTLPGQESLR